MSPAPVTAGRRREVRRLVTRRRIASQGQLVEMLAAAGYKVTQATVSRDLEAIGARRRIDEGGRPRYEIPEPAPHAAGLANLARLLAEFVSEITPSGNLVVLRTPPGAAHVVASAMDGTVLDGLVGTVAGDDTVLAIADEKVGGWRVAKDLERLGANT